MRVFRRPTKSARAQEVTTEWIIEGDAPYISLASLLDVLALSEKVAPENRSGFRMVRGTLLEMWFRESQSEVKWPK